MQHPRFLVSFTLLSAFAASQIFEYVSELISTRESQGLIIRIILYTGFLFVSLRAIWTLQFHPLAKYPGPALAALTNCYTAYHLVKGDRHLDFYRMHQKYGKIVRYAPSRLSINSITALQDIYGVQANTQKSQVYGTFKHFFSGTEMSMTEIDKTKHAAKRRVNATALSTEALKRVEPAIQKNIDYFLTTLPDDQDGWSQPRDVSQIVGYLISDVMGDVTFSKNWDVQRDPTRRHFVDDSALGTAGIHLTGHLPGLFTLNMHRILFKPLIDGIQQLARVSNSITEWRVAQGDSLKGRDLFSALMNATDPETGKPYTHEELVSEAGLLIVGGTDTTITAATAAIFYLTHNQTHLEKVREELTSAFKSSDDIVGGPILDRCRYLTACIEETLRVSPPVGSILPREVLPGGLMVDGEALPAGIDVGVPHYTLQHDPAHYPDPFAFKPDRWLGVGPDGIPSSGTKRARDALVTFGVGRTSCIGKRLAYRELHLLIARLVFDFDIRIAPGTKLGQGGPGKGRGREREDEFQLLDRFVAMQHGPMVQFRRRISLHT